MIVATTNNRLQQLHHRPIPLLASDLSEFSRHIRLFLPTIRSHRHQESKPLGSCNFPFLHPTAKTRHILIVRELRRKRPQAFTGFLSGSEQKTRRDESTPCLMHFYLSSALHCPYEAFDWRSHTNENLKFTHSVRKVFGFAESRSMIIIHEIAKKNCVTFVFNLNNTWPQEVNLSTCNTEWFFNWWIRTFHCR